MNSFLNLYLAIIFCLSVVMGLQVVMIPWLAIDYLNLSASAVGVVQFVMFIPNVVLLLLGGIHADRGGLLPKLLCLLLVYGLIHGLLLLLLAQDWLSYITLLVYVLLLGCVVAFIQPCKDYLVGSLAQNRLQSFIAKNSLSQYSGQAFGFVLAPVLYSQQWVLLPLAQMVLLGLAFVLLALLMKRNDLPFDSSSKTLTEPVSSALLMSGFAQCWRSSTLRCLLAIVALNGFFHIGVFVVALPLLARDVYLGGMGFFSLLQCLFVLGSAAVTLMVIVKGDMDAPGRRVIFGLLYSALILLGLSLGPTQYGMMMLIFIWGAVVGVSAILGRAIVQSQAVAEYRGRVISIYQVALFGSAPLGSLCAGFAIDTLGVLYVLKLSAIISFIAFVAMLLTRSLWDLEAGDTRSAAY